MQSSTKLTFREFKPGDELAFRELNEAWIRRYFALEEKDKQTFADPQSKIIDHGGHIYFAILNEEQIGCCALLPMSPGEFEVAKMAVSEKLQRGGIGRGLLKYVIQQAQQLGATRLYLETNHTLLPAIALYKQLGFEAVPTERVVASPYERADVHMELFLPQL